MGVRVVEVALPRTVDGAHTPPEHRSSAVHALPSLHTVPSVSWFGTHWPEASHVSGLSHDVSEGFPHDVPAATAVCAQPVDASHVSVVHPFWSSQLGAAPPTH